MNVFVAHLGGRSFGYAKRALAAQNNAALFARYPHYEAAYTAFQLEDPLRVLREKISRNACRRLPSGTLLHVYPWADRRHPVVEAAQQDAADRCEPWAALFILPCGASSRAMLRLCHDVPLADMSFVLPQEAEALHGTVGRCAFKAFRLHGLSAAIRRVAASLNLPEEALPPPSLPVLPIFRPSGGACLVAPPRAMSGWKRLCRVAVGHPDTLFWVCRLEAFWGDIPRPANVCSLPLLEDMAPLSLGALVLAEAADTAAVAAWQKWLKRHVGTAVPVCLLSPEAA